VTGTQTSPLAFGVVVSYRCQPINACTGRLAAAGCALYRLRSTAGHRKHDRRSCKELGGGFEDRKKLLEDVGKKCEWALIVAVSIRVLSVVKEKDCQVDLERSTEEDQGMSIGSKLAAKLLPSAATKEKKKFLQNPK
jgi:hypothetical protein